MADKKIKVSREENRGLQLDASAVYDTLDYWSIYGFAPQLNNQVQMTIFRLVTDRVAEELGVTLDSQEIEFLKTISPETLDVTTQALLQHPVELLEKRIFPVIDQWKEEGYGLFPNSYDHAKETYLAEVASYGSGKKPLEKTRTS